MEVKPGVRTTEFWTNLLTQAVSGFVVLYTLVFHRHFVNAETLNALIVPGAMIASGISQAVYTLSRGKVKAAAHSAVQVRSTVESTTTNGQPTFSNPQPSVFNLTNLPTPEQALDFLGRLKAAGVDTDALVQAAVASGAAQAMPGGATGPA